MINYGLANRGQGFHLCLHAVRRTRPDISIINLFLPFIYGINRLRGILLPIIFLSMVPELALSQMILASGLVLDENNNPVVNCHISVENTNLGTVTNGQGEFKLKIPKGPCKGILLVSYVGYQTQSVKLNCRDRPNMVIGLKHKLHQLQEVTVSALSASQIVLQAILNIEKNYQIDSVTYTLFSRITEIVDTSPVLMEEFVFDLFHGKKTNPEFYIKKIRAKGFSKLGEKRLDDNRLTDMYITGGHMMLRYLPPFLKKSKMKRYNYEVTDELVINGDQYYAISATPLKKNEASHGKIRVHKKNYGISYLEQRFPGEYWHDMGHLNYVHVSHYKQEGDKWYFLHGTRSYYEMLKEQNITINHHQVTVATDRSDAIPNSKKQETKGMVKMLKHFTGSYDDEFWGSYNFIPVERNFKDN